ncbi:glycosyltransferase family 2 protein [Ammoniphilus sp. YIM 78166]|uniref:glycosyltransferase family 2 protein n=1 Tax=Ammoniphilus sp. YIM 78166 TaxID=1644106 RepID=UPI00106F5C6B|nr:glycosyltransferase family 2 protein [Ammoniphilus sp. YIM 78166]
MARVGKVTVVIPVYNRALLLSKAVDSVLAQSYKDWNLVIVDDASTDHSLEICSNYLGDSRIRVLQMPENSGTGKCLNYALSFIDTPYFVILDSDDWLEPTTLDVLLKKMEEEPSTTSLVYGNTKIWKEDQNGLHFRSIRKYRSFQDKYDFIMYPHIPYPRFFRTETVREVRGFESDIPYEGRYGEDRYLLLKLIAVSRFSWIDEDLYNLRIHSTNITKTDQKKFATVREYLYSKMLQEWGGKYRPIFEMRKDGWLVLRELQPVDSLSQ